LELVCCKLDVYKKAKYDFIEVFLPVVLFKKGNLYPVYHDVDHHWIATDEEGKEHIIATGNNPRGDPWFAVHFELKS
jgi:hypothetical protein